MGQARRCGAASEPRSGGARKTRHGAAARGTPPPQKSKTSDCHNLTFVVCIFIRARFYADDVPYSFGNLLLKIVPFLIIVGIVASLAFCGG